MSKRLMLFAGNSHLGFARQIAKHLGLPLYEPDYCDENGNQVLWFSNENCFVDIKTKVTDCHCFVIQTQAPGRALVGKDDQGNDLFGQDLRVSDMITELLMMIRALKAAGAKVTAVMPYMPYIRSDKKDHPRSCVAARLFADQLIRAGADGILLMDPHFDQIHGFFDETKMKVSVLKARPVIAKYFLINKKLSEYAIAAPDASEAKRSSSLAGLLNLEMGFVYKKRIGDAEKVVPVALIGKDAIEGKKTIMPDDEIASGGTIVEGANFAVKNGAKSVLPALAHPVLTSMDALQALQDNDAIEEVIVTDTIPVPQEKRDILRKLRVLTVAPNFAEAIRTIYHGDSLHLYKRSLYDGFDELLEKNKRL